MCLRLQSSLLFLWVYYVLCYCDSSESCLLKTHGGVDHQKFQVSFGAGIVLTPHLQLGKSKFEKSLRFWISELTLVGTNKWQPLQLTHLCHLSIKQTCSKRIFLRSLNTSLMGTQSDFDDAQKKGNKNLRNKLHVRKSVFLQKSLNFLNRILCSWKLFAACM